VVIAFIVIFFLLAAVFGLLWLNSIFKSEADPVNSTYLPPEQQAIAPRVPDVFDEARIKTDLAKLSGQPTALAHYIAQAQLRFTQARQIAVLERWTEFYNAGRSVIKARTELARAHADLQQVSTESEIKAKEKEVKIAALEAELEEAALRRAEARVRRENLGRESKPEEPKLSAEQHRVLKKAEIEAKLARVRLEKITAVEAAQEDEEKIMIGNMYDDQIIQLLQELRKYL
jgi:hypothetical protein